MAITVDRDLEWYLTVGEAAYGASGTFGPMVSIMIFGPGVPNPQPLCDDRQLGWGRHHGRGTVARASRLDRVWRKLSVEDRVLLRAYVAPPVRIPPAFKQALGRLAAPALALGLERVDNRVARRTVEGALTRALERWQAALLGHGVAA